MRILRFNESVSNSYSLGQDILKEIHDICLPLKDEMIDYNILPMSDDHIGIKLLGIYLNGGAKRTKFEVSIKVLNLNELKVNELLTVIKQLKNFSDYEGLRCSFVLEYQKTIPVKYGRVGSTTNSLEVDNFSLDMMNSTPFTKETPFRRENNCRKITITFNRIKNDNNY
jgi:hypothetical protein